MRVEDPDNFISIAQSERLPLSDPKLPAIDAAEPTVVDEEMLVGPRPSVPNSPQTVALPLSPATSNHRLLLIHGYCSSDVWFPVYRQFTNAAVFRDLEQNRSIDDFARRIGDWARRWNSYAIVAHSQGGMAALHLYTYHWSGLDYAGRGRLIQSVGTPYQALV